MTDQNALDIVREVSKYAQYTKAVQINDGPNGLTGTGFGTNGLDTDNSIGKSYDINVDLMPHLGRLNYSRYIPEYYDCEDRALWGMAHLRRRFPGCRVGVASGIAPPGHPSFADKPHAVNVLWYYGNAGFEPLYFDPVAGRVDPPGLNNIASVIAFPTGAGADTVIPLVGMHRLNNETLLYDKERLIYPLRDPNKGILDYLEQRVYDRECDEIAHHDKDSGVTTRTFESLWTDYDEALWAFVHVRRAFPGCLVGVAIGDFGTAALSIWSEDQGGSRNHIYWDPKSGRELTFSPKMIFM